MAWAHAGTHAASRLKHLPCNRCHFHSILFVLHVLSRDRRAVAGAAGEVPLSCPGCLSLLQSLSQARATRYLCFMACVSGHEIYNLYNVIIIVYILLICLRLSSTHAAPCRSHPHEPHQSCSTVRLAWHEVQLQGVRCELMDFEGL